MKYYFADVAAILAAAERDSQYVGDLNERLKRLLTYFTDPQTCIKHLGAVSKTSATLYYGLTWLSSSKTLGEEYAQLEPVDVFSRSTPTWFLRLLYILFQVHIVPVLPKQFKSIIFPLHLVLFYKNGIYLDPVKRFLGIRMVQVVTRKPMSPFHYCLLICTLANALLDLQEYLRDSYNRTQIAPKSSHDCPLCKDKMDTPTVCPCGHVYCWQCITEWTGRFPQCPLCRQECHVKQLYSIAL